MTSTHTTPPVQRREIFGWAMFDFANSSYTTVVITAVFSAFFTEQIVPPGSTGRDSYWSIAIIISTLIALFLSPLAGAICDLSGRKKPYLLASAILCALATAALYFVGPGDITTGIILIAISNAAFMLSEAFCGSFLTELATKDTMAKISGLGWGLGYFGGLASLAMVMLITSRATENDPASAVHQIQISMVATGAFFMLASLPTLFLVKNRRRPKPGFENAPLGKLMRAGFGEFKNTFATARENKVLFQFLIAFMVYMAGIDVVIKFVGIYARAELNFGMGDLTVMFLILQISAAAGALAFGFLESWFGPKNTVLLTLAWWIVGIMAIFFLDPLSQLLGVEAKQVFFGISLIAGAGIGATQSSSRAVVGLLAPAEKSAEMFGFWGMFGRLATILGMSFGFLSDALSSRRLALLLVVAFFVVGGALLARTPISKAIKAGS